MPVHEYVMARDVQGIPTLSGVRKVTTHNRRIFPKGSIFEEAMEKSVFNLNLSKLTLNSILYHALTRKIPENPKNPRNFPEKNLKIC